MNHQLTPDQIRAAISAIDENHNLWRCVLSLAEYEITDALDPVCLPGISDSERAHAAGWLAHARAFRATLDQVMAQAKDYRERIT